MCSCQGQLFYWSMTSSMVWEWGWKTPLLELTPPCFVQVTIHCSSTSTILLMTNGTFLNSSYLSMFSPLIELGLHEAFGFIPCLVSTSTSFKLSVLITFEPCLWPFTLLSSYNHWTIANSQYYVCSYEIQWWCVFWTSSYWKPKRAFLPYVWNGQEI